MVKLANFTLHDQQEHVDRWREFGFEMDPAPKAPLIEFEQGEWTEEAILEAVTNGLAAIRAEGFDAILSGGLSNCMAYAWLLAPRYGLQVVQARTPRKRTPDGKFIFELAGYVTLLSPAAVWNWPDARIIDRAMKDAREHLLNGDALRAVDSLIVALEALKWLSMDEPLTRAVLEEHLNHVKLLLLESKHGTRATELSPQELERVLRHVEQAKATIG